MLRAGAHALPLDGALQDHHRLLPAVEGAQVVARVSRIRSP
ncbi:hypothetical protein [Streptomyces sulfonofaciens]|nr:hypothetical protein [Streptomyces sulfonofaciens]